MKNRAFTLIELLVVIGILAALLLPALSRAKATAKRIHCVGNVKQLSLAAHFYADDHQDWLPPSLIDLDMRFEGDSHVFSRNAPYGREPLDFLGGGLAWHHHLLFGYLDGNTNLFQCAGNFGLESRVKKTLDYWGRLGADNLRQHTRAFNFAYGWGENEDGKDRNGNPKLIKRSQIVSPSDHIQLGDTPGWNYRRPFHVFNLTLG